APSSIEEALRGGDRKRGCHDRVRLEAMLDASLTEAVRQRDEGHRLIERQVDVGDRAALGVEGVVEAEVAVDVVAPGERPEVRRRLGGGDGGRQRRGGGGGGGWAVAG